MEKRESELCSPSGVASVRSDGIAQVLGETGACVSDIIKNDEMFHHVRVRLEVEDSCCLVSETHERTYNTEGCFKSHFIDNVVLLIC